MELRQIMQPIQIDYICDICGKGKMRPTGMMLTSNPLQYSHRCIECDSHNNFTVRYPYITYEVKR